LVARKDEVVSEAVGAVWLPFDEVEKAALPTPVRKILVQASSSQSEPPALF
jgi:hypothetical protein